MHITPDLVEAMYELLRSTRPFRRWKLPHADEVEFHVIASPRFYADHCIDRRHILRISATRVSSLATLVPTLAHEMIHMRQAGLKARDVHGRTFQKMADQVCREHGFDRGAF